MKITTLGKSELKITPVTLGCMTFTGDSTWGAQDEKDSIDTVRAALDAGIVSFDTSENYANGFTEEVLRKGLGKERSKVTIMSKVGKVHLKKDDVIAACEGSLKRMGTDYIDLYQIHWPNVEIPMEETMEALVLLKKQGKIREIGVSNFGTADLETVIGYGEAVSNQLAYNLFMRGIEFSIVPKCIANNMGIFTYSSLAQGLLSGKYATADSFPEGRARTKIFAGSRPQARHGGPGCEEEAFRALNEIRSICEEAQVPMGEAALAWSLAQPGITSVIAGARTPQQVYENVKAGERVLAQETIDRLSQATAQVKAFIGDDADPWDYGRIHNL